MNKEMNILYGKEKKEIWHSILELENNIDNSNAFYVNFDEVVKMLDSEKDYLKMRGFRIICKLSKWDKDNKINIIIDKLLEVLDSSKPTIIRMCLQMIGELIIFKKDLSSIIKAKLVNIDLSKFNDSMRPLIKKDIDLLLK